MATVTKYHLTITQTRPDTNTKWYERETSEEWLDAWKAFNFYDVETTIEPFEKDPYTTIIAHAKITAIFPEEPNSNRELIKTRKYSYIPEDVYNEFIALLNNDESGLSAERRYDEAHGITYELDTETEVQNFEAT
jgi:hypothetical protein